MSVWLPGTNISPVDLAYERSLLPRDIFDGEADEDLDSVQEQSIRSLWDDTPARPSPPSSADVSSLSGSFSSLYFPNPVPVVLSPGQELSLSFSSSSSRSSSSPGQFSYAVATGSNQNQMTPKSTPHSQAPVPVRPQQQQQQQENVITPYEKRQQELLHNFMIQDRQRQDNQYQQSVQQNRQKITRRQLRQAQTNQLTQFHTDCNNNVIAILPHPTTQMMKMQQQQQQPPMMKMQQQQPPMMNNMRQPQQPPMMVCNGVVSPTIGVPGQFSQSSGPGQFAVHQLHPGFKFNGFNGQSQHQPQPQSQPTQEFVCKYRRRRHNLPNPGSQ